MRGRKGAKEAEQDAMGERKVAESVVAARLTVTVKGLKRQLASRLGILCALCQCTSGFSQRVTGGWTTETRSRTGWR